MTDRLVHRGPDGEGFHLDDGVALGHRRLSIIDLAGGNQPIFNEDRTVAIVFNGEIYNYLEIRQMLIERGHTFRTESDTEVIVHLYEEEGIGCLRHLNGMFAFALWDSRRHKLFAARDRMGEKPLYYSYLGESLYFASELKGLLASGQIPQHIDIGAIDAYLAYGYVPAPRSIFENVRKLPAGHYLVLEGGQLEIAPYWQVTFPEPIAISDEDALDQLRELLDESVRIRLRSDVPVGAFLSGGIDSSLIVSRACSMMEDKLATFSIGFSEQDFDELAYARKVAERYGTDHHEFIVDDIDSDLFADLVRQFDEPFADPSAFPTCYVTRIASSELKVVLSGDGGDELFCGYKRYQGEVLEAWITKLPLPLRRSLFGRASSLLPDTVRGKGWLARMAADDAERWQRTVGIFDPPERATLWLEAFNRQIDLEPSLLSAYFSRTDLDARSHRLFADQVTYLSDDVLVKVDRNSMWHSLEVRVPLLDHRIVEFANSLPIALKYRDGELKYPLKKLLEGQVPDELIHRPKSGFSLPIKHWLKAQLYEYSREMLLSADSSVRDYFDIAALRSLVEGNRKGNRDLSRRIWSMIWLEQWLRSFGTRGNTQDQHRSAA